MGHHESAKSKKGRGNFEHLRVTGSCQITIPETPEQAVEVALEPSRALERKEDIVHGQGCHVIGRIAPLAARAVEQDEIGALPKQDVPWMKVAVDLPQPVHAVFQTPSPIDTLVFDVLQERGVDRILS